MNILLGVVCIRIFSFFCKTLFSSFMHVQRLWLVAFYIPSHMKLGFCLSSNCPFQICAFSAAPTIMWCLIPAENSLSHITHSGSTFSYRISHSVFSPGLCLASLPLIDCTCAFHLFSKDHQLSEKNDKIFKCILIFLNRPHDRPETNIKVQATMRFKHTIGYWWLSWKPP